MHDRHFWKKVQHLLAMAGILAKLIHYMYCHNCNTCWAMAGILAILINYMYWHHCNTFWAMAGILAILFFYVLPILRYLKGHDRLGSD